VAAAAAHKETLLALLSEAQEPADPMAAPAPPGPADASVERPEAIPSNTPPGHPGAEAEEAVAIAWEGQGGCAPAQLAEAVAEVEGHALAHCGSWADWRSEWIAEVGLLALRSVNAGDAQVRAQLGALIRAKPSTKEDWLTLGHQIFMIETELRQGGMLPAYHWPALEEG
jgi:hypothetical protein